MIEITPEFAHELLQYIEGMEEAMEGERGDCRSAELMYQQDDMPGVYDKLRKMVEVGQ